MKKPTAMVVVGVLITAAILGSVWMLTSGGTLQLSLGGQAAPGQIGQEVVGSCATAGINPAIYSSAYWVDNTQNGKKTQVATTLLLAKQDTSLIFNSTTGSTTAATVTTIPCGTHAVVLAGDGGGTTYYYNGQAFDAVGVSHSFDIEVKKSGAATIDVHNDTAVGWAATILLGNNSLTDPDTIDLRFSPPVSAGQMFGDIGYGACVKYASLNFTNVYPQPNAGTTQIAHVGGSSAHDAVRCYDMPGTLVAGGTPYIGVLFFDKVASAFQNSTISIDITLVDKTSGLFNGRIYVGYDTSAPGGDGQNTDLGRADVTTSNILNVTGVPA